MVRAKVGANRLLQILRTHRGGVTRTTEETSSGTADADAVATSETNNTVVSNATGTETKTDTSDLTPTEVPAADVTMSKDPMKEDLDQNAGKNSWVYRNLKWNYDAANYVITTIINKRPDLYFFEGLVDYNESKHIIVLLGLDKNSALAGYSQNDVYGYIVHTGNLKESDIRANTESFIVTAGSTYTSSYKNTDYPVQVRNYGTNVEVNLMAGKGSDQVLDSEPGKVYGLVPVFDDGINKDKAGKLDLTTIDDKGETVVHGWVGDYLLGEGLYDYYAKQKSITSWQTPIPQMTTLTIRYVDQATGEDLLAPKTIAGFTYQGFEISNLATPQIDGYKIAKEPTVDGEIQGQISQYKVGETYPLYYSDNVVVQQTVLNQDGDVLARAYFNGLPIPGCSKILKHNSTDTMTIIYDGQLHVYQNKIGTVQQSLIYRYQKLDQANQSTLTVHYIDITDAKLRSGFLPTDGKEVATQSYTGKIGAAYTATLPADYQDYAIMQGDLTGTFSTTVHDAYVYLSNQDADKYTPVAQPITVVSGTVVDEALAKAAITNAAQLPEGTKYVWTKAPNTATLGDQEGELQIQYPDHTTDTVKVPVTVTGKAFPTLPTDLLLVDDVKNLTDSEKQTLVKRLNETANPNRLEVNNDWEIPDFTQVAADGTIKVAHRIHNIFGAATDYSVTIPGSLLVRKKQFADVYAPTTPATKVGVKNTQNLQADEKAKVKQAIIDANQANPAWTDGKVKGVVIASDGTATIIYTDKSTDTIAGTDLVTSLQSGHHMVVMPEKILVVDPADLSDSEKQAALHAVQRKNPASETTHVVSVGFADNEETTVMVTYDDGSHNYVEVSQLVKAAMLFPNPTPVQDLKALTLAEKEAVEKAIRDKNANYFPTDYLSDTSLVTVAVNNNGSATITYNTLGADGQTLTPTQSLTIPAEKLVKLADKVAHQAQTPDQKTPVVNKAQLNDTEKEKVAAAILDYNHKQDNTFLTKEMIKIADDGTATITYPDQTSMSIPGTKLVSQYVVTAKAGQSVPRGVTVDPKSLITVTDEDGNTYDLPADAFTWKTPLDNSKVTDQASGVVTVNLSGTSVDKPVTVKVVASQADQAVTPAQVGYDLEKTIASVKDAIARQLQTANPDATVEVAENGDATLTFKDGSVKTFKANELAQGYQIKVVNTKIIKGNSKSAHSFIQVLDEAGQPVAGLDNLETWREEPKWDQVTDHTLTGKINVTLPGVNQLTVTRDVTLTVVDNLADQVQTPEKVGYFKEEGITGQVKDAVKQALVAANTDGDQQTLFTLNQIEIADDGTVTISFPGQTATKQFKLADLTTAYTVADAKASAVHEVGSLAAKDAVTITGENPAQVKAEWQTGPDLSKITDNGSGTVIVTLPGGVAKPVDVTYQVTAADSDYELNTTDNKKVPVKDNTKLTDKEKQAVVDQIRKDNPALPGGDQTQITIENDGTAKIAYPDGTKDEVPGEKLVKPADSNYELNTTDNKKVPVKDNTKLTDKEKQAVVDQIRKDNPNLPGGDQTQIEVSADGSATITYPDGTQDSISGDKLVVADVKLEIDAQDKIYDGQPSPFEVTLVDGKGNHLTLHPSEGDLAFYQIKDGVKVPTDLMLKFMRLAVMPSAEPTLVLLDEVPVDPGHYEIRLSESGKQGLLAKYGNQYRIENLDVQTEFYIVPVKDAVNPNVPTEKVLVNDPTNLSDGEKSQVKDNVVKANQDDQGNSTLPKDAEIKVGNDGTVTITYADGSEDTINGSQLVEQNEAGKTNPTIPDKTKVDDPTNLSDGEKDQVKDNVEKNNPGTTVTVGDDGTATIKYPDQSTDTIPGKDLVTGKTDAEKTQPTVPGDKTKVDDPTNLSDGEKAQVKDNVEKSNPGTTVTVDNDGTATIKYPDQSTDTIPGKDLVTGKTDAEKTQPTVPGDKTKVDDPTNLSDGEKAQVKDNVEKSNPGTTVTVDNDGTAKITYPDKSTDTIPGKELVAGKTDAEKTQPTVPEDKTKVDDPTNLTVGEKAQVKDNVGKANPETAVTVENDGTATITYPDGSKATISGDQLVKGKTDAEKATPNLPTTKTPVQDPSHLTPAEQAAVQANVAKANAGAVVTVDAYGNATLTYRDGSQLTLKADQLVKAAVNATVAPSPSAATPAPTPAATPVQAAALPQTGDANATALALSGLTLALIGLIGAKKKRSEEN